MLKLRVSAYDDLECVLIGDLIPDSILLVCHPVKLALGDIIKVLSLVFMAGILSLRPCCCVSQDLIAVFKEEDVVPALVDIEAFAVLALADVVEELEL